jgi:LPS export ABC transporter protein LptC
MMKLPVYIGVLLAVVFAACENKMSEIQGISDYDKLPTVSSYDFVMLYSDSARVKARLEAPKRDNYEGDNPYVEMPLGMKVVFYDSIKRPETTLTGIMEARNNVVVTNSKGETLNTEQLMWDERSEKLYSDVFVKITTPDQIIFGEGFESNQNFTQYRINKIKGTIKVKNNPVDGK